MTLEEIRDKLEKSLTRRRFVHSVNVMNCSVDLAAKYGENKDRAAVAGLLHDCARDIKGRAIFDLCDKFGIKPDGVKLRQPELLHGPVGSYIAQVEYGVTDEGILDAIRFHTTGCENMSLLSKIIFIADYIEPGRNFHGIADIRNLAYVDIDRAMICALDRTIRHIMSKGALIHTDTVNARNFLISGINA